MSLCSLLIRTSPDFPTDAMPRPLCPRHIGHHPPCDFFKPAGIPLYELKEVVLAADELEALRLADVEDLFHTKAAVRMGVSRQTFDRIVRRARMKVAEALVRGLALRIERAPADPARKTPVRGVRARPMRDTLSTRHAAGRSP